MNNHIRRAHSWTLARRLTDWAFRISIPGKHHNLENSLMVLLSIRELRP